MLGAISVLEGMEEFVFEDFDDLVKKINNPKFYKKDFLIKNYKIIYERFKPSLVAKQFIKEVLEEVFIDNLY